MPLLVKRLHPDASLPVYGSGQAAGMDLHAYCPGEEIVLNSGERQLIKSGIAVAIPEGFYGRIAPRSGLAFKNGIDVMAGVIDSDYRGEMGVILINLGNADFKIKHGDRIAQMIIEIAPQMEVIEVENLDDTERGAGGFGSTGVGKDKTIRSVRLIP